MQRCLMLGSGHKKPERLYESPWSASQEETEWTTLDWYVDADIKLNLWDVATKGAGVVPLPPQQYHEIHAYEVLEHFGTQGIPEHFFNTFNWLWEMLVPNGFLIGTCPMTTGPWIWSDPGHTRVIDGLSLSFLKEDFYKQCGKTAASDYRSLINGRYWDVKQAANDPKTNFFAFALQKVVK